MATSGPPPPRDDTLPPFTGPTSSASSSLTIMSDTAVTARLRWTSFVFSRPSAHDNGTPMTSEEEAVLETMEPALLMPITCPTSARVLQCLNVAPTTHEPRLRRALDQIHRSLGLPWCPTHSASEPIDVLLGRIFNHDPAFGVIVSGPSAIHPTGLSMARIPMWCDVNPLSGDDDPGPSRGGQTILFSDIYVPHAARLRMAQRRLEDFCRRVPDGVVRPLPPLLRGTSSRVPAEHLVLPPSVHGIGPHVLFRHCVLRIMVD